MATRADPAYRATKFIRQSLVEHAVIYLEESLYLSAVQLFSSLLLANQSASTSIESMPGLPPASIPPPQILALLTTITVHPSLTTRTIDTSFHTASDAALLYIRDLICVVGSRNARLHDAWIFRGDGQANGRRENKRQKLKREEERRTTVGDATGESLLSDRDEVIDIQTPLVDLFARVDDFWCIVGWSLNCAACYPGRWSRYKLLLRVMLEALEIDWHDRLNEDKRMPSDHNSMEQLQGSILCRYVTSELVRNRTGRRRLLRAIFADGSSKSLAEFGEIWRDETKERKPEEWEERLTKNIKDRTKRKVLDVDAGEFGDYYDNEDDEDEELAVVKSEPGTARTRSIRKSRRTAATPSRLAVEELEGAQTRSETSLLGDHEALTLRKRLLTLLVPVATHLPHVFVTMDELLDDYSETLRPLPIFAFAFLMSRRGSLHEFSPPAYIHLASHLLRPLVPSVNPRNATDAVSLTKLYLPHAASTIGPIDNARLAIIMENLLRLIFWDHEMKPEEDSGKVSVAMSLRESLSEGIAQRESRAAASRHRNEEKLEAEFEAGEWLRESHRRMNVLLQHIINERNE